MNLNEIEQLMREAHALDGVKRLAYSRMLAKRGSGVGALLNDLLDCALVESESGKGSRFNALLPLAGTPNGEAHV